MTAEELKKSNKRHEKTLNSDMVLHENGYPSFSTILFKRDNPNTRKTRKQHDTKIETSWIFMCHIYIYIYSLKSLGK